MKVADPRVEMQGTTQPKKYDFHTIASMGHGDVFTVSNGNASPPRPALLQARHRLQMLFKELGIDDSGVWET